MPSNERVGARNLRQECRSDAFGGVTMTNTIRNPVLPGFHPDPSICRVGEDYYLVTSSFEYFPGVPVFHSRDLVHWRQIGHCLTRPSQLALELAGCSAGIYAPTIRHHAGRFYMITTNVSIGQHVLVSTDEPAGDWSEPIFLKHGGIDPSLLFDTDGSVYLTTQGDGIMQTRIDPDTGAFLSETQTVWRGSGGAYEEGPHLYHIGEWYYLMVAEGGTAYGHMETMARSRSPWGAFEACPFNPILSNRSSADSLQCTGHADLVEDHRGDWWAVFLATRSSGHPPRHHLGRETCLAPVRWTAEGWPVIGERGRVSVSMSAKPLPAQPWPALPVRDDFRADRLGLEWNFMRNPKPGITTRGGGGLRLHGSAVSLNDEDSPAWLGRRQEHMCCDIETDVQFEAQTASEEAGLCVLMNHRHHYEIALGLGRVFVRQRIGSLQAVVAEAACASRTVQLRIKADELEYNFAWSGNGGRTWQNLAHGEVRYLTTEVAGGFTGVYLAMYATGNGQPCARPAAFAWCAYQGDFENRPVAMLRRWRVSPILLKTGPVGSLELPTEAAAQQWPTLEAETSGFVNVHLLNGDRDGLVCLATRVEATTAGEWLLHLGHDGGCRLFVDSVETFIDERLRNPAIPWRSQVRLALTAGVHELLIVFDLAGGRGWGIFAGVETSVTKPALLELG